MNALRRRPVVVGIAAALVVLAALVVVGRWERARNARIQNARMDAVYRLATSGGIVSNRLWGYRLSLRFDCLGYAPPARPRDLNALEVCFDANGYVVETIDRRTGSPRFASLIEEPSLATTHVSPLRVLAAFRALGAYRYDSRFKVLPPHMTTLPMGNNDTGMRFAAEPPTGG